MNTPPSTRSGAGSERAWFGVVVIEFEAGLANGEALGGVPREQRMLKGHLPRVMYHQVY